MVFRKYKPVTQWGKQDTRIFKAILNAKNLRKTPHFAIPDAVKALGVTVHDPRNASFFDGGRDEVLRTEKEHAKMRKEAEIKSHPLYDETPCQLFDATEPMSDGMAQACVLTKSILHTSFPPVIAEKNLEYIDEDQVRDAILQGERFDPTLEKLPRRFDPVLFWVKHPRVHGTPVIKRGNIILNNLFRHILLAAVGKGKLKPTDYKLDRDEPFSASLLSAPYFSESPFVIRGQPHITLQRSAKSSRNAWASPEEVQKMSGNTIPSIYPLSPLIDLSSDHVYNRGSLIVRDSEKESIAVHTLAWTREQDQKYPWTTEQNAANAILTTFGAALAEAQRRGERNLAESPVVARGVQLVNGRLDLVTVQLNTLDMSESCEMKNVVWVEKACPLYKTRPFYEQLQSVENIDMETVSKLTALLVDL